MKFFIVGLHCSGKQEILDILEKQGVSVGRLFSNIESASPQIYNSYNYELMSTKDINEMFENKAYLFLQELESSATSKSSNKPISTSSREWALITQLGALASTCSSHSSIKSPIRST